MGLYQYFKDEKLSDGHCVVIHKEGDKITLIAATEDAEKAHFIVTACNLYHKYLAMTGDLEKS